MASRARCEVFVVGDRATVRQKLAALIESQRDMTFAGQARAEDPGKALAAVAKAAPDVVIVDLDGLGSGAIGLIRRIRREQPATAVLVMTEDEETFLAEQAFSQGARGHVRNLEGGDEVAAAVRRLASGDIYVSRQLSPVLLQRLLRASIVDGAGPLSSLTQRELQVFTLIGEGLRTREIAEELGLSIKTIEAHRGHIRRKLNLRGSQALDLVAARWMPDKVDE